MKAPLKSFLLLLFSCFFMLSCQSYYRKNLDFNNHFQKGDFEKANKILDSDKKAEKRKTKLLFYMNKGVVFSLMGKYKESNEYFEKAYIFIQDNTNKPMDIAAAMVTNSNVIEYSGEEFEKLLIHYYKAINFMKLQENEAALVECRRMNIRLQILNDKYKGANKYKKDAFMHLLMGLIYDANAEYNNAFIAYRNAYEIYLSDYTKFFNTEAPLQLKKDILRTAYLSSLFDELDRYEKEFNLVLEKSNSKNGDLVFLWQNGLGPIKEEWAINFAVIKGQGGVIVFQNQELGLNFSFPMSDADYKSNGLGDLKVIRVAFPKYIERSTLYHKADLVIDNEIKHLELAEDINKIAFKCLEQRMLEELGKSLLRVALKQAAEYQLRKKNEGAGAVLGIINAATEKADTRNWQTLPYSIYYTRVSMPEGTHNIKLLTFENNGRSTEIPFTFIIKKGNTILHSFQSLETIPFNFNVNY